MANLTRADLIRQIPPFTMLSVTDSHLCIFAKKQAGGDLYEPLFKLDDLYMLEPRLRSVIAYLCSASLGRAFDENTFESLYLHATLAYWEKAGEIITTNGNAYKIAGDPHIRFVSGPSGETVQAKSYFDALEIHEIRTSDGSIVPIVIRASLTNALISLSWVDSVYPGWRERLGVAQSLDLSPEETNTYILRSSSQNNTSVSIELPDMQ